MADALMGVTETSANALAQVSELAQIYLQQESKLLPTVTDYSFLATKGSSSIKLPRSGGFTVGDKAENTRVDSQVITYAADTISLDQHRVIQFLLEDIADQQSMVAVTQDALLKASKDLAFDIDKKIKAEFDNASTSSPDHVIQYNDATNEDIEKTDILEMRRLLVVQNINPRECFLGLAPGQEKNMLLIDDFVHAEKYGSSIPVMQGEIGMVYGMRVIVSNVFDGTDSYAWHPTAVGMALQQGVRVQRDYDLANLAWRYSLDYLAGFEILDSGKRVVKIEETA
jgi:N4-gp56 family major capsid protein